MELNMVYIVSINHITILDLVLPSALGTVNKPRGQPYGGGGSLKDHVLPHEGGRGDQKIM